MWCPSIWQVCTASSSRSPLTRLRCHCACTDLLLFSLCCKPLCWRDAVQEVLVPAQHTAQTWHAGVGRAVYKHAGVARTWLHCKPWAVLVVQPCNQKSQAPFLVEVWLHSQPPEGYRLAVHDAAGVYADGTCVSCDRFFMHRCQYRSVVGTGRPYCAVAVQVFATSAQRTSYTLQAAPVAC